MSQYPEDDYRPHRGGGRGRDEGTYQPYPAYPPDDGPNDYGSNAERPPRYARHPPDHFNQPPPPPGANSVGETLPPPPMGDALPGGSGGRPSAMKREGSRSRVPQQLRPDFPDEASYMGSTAPDLERKNRPKDRAFRERRDGYGSEEGETLRLKHPPRKDDDRDRDRDRDRRDRRPRDDRDAYADSGPPRRPKDRREESFNQTRDYDDRDRDPPRRRRDGERRRYDDDDDDPPPRRRGGGGGGVEYGSDPVPVRRRNTVNDRSRTDRDKPRRRRDDDYSDESEDDRRRRHRSQEDRPRRPRDKYEDDNRSYDTDPRDRDQRRRRQDIYDRDQDDRRHDKSRRRGYSDDDYDDYDRRDRRGGRDGGGRDDRDSRRNKPPKEMKIGNYDVGPMVEMGKKHYGTLAPIVTPMIMQAAKKYMAGK
ncbi:hypothetical protein LTR62_003469 [Meristemomyces frigidus]|uniref:Uncharacterized protein n=1 Tax=Meristemomyces frigidus TaxID=1508187 RepID=A0AAN7TJ74_9PEZI|nr:hypothetical protein LTR62_003469 [Meristemomyces frigidus]